MTTPNPTPSNPADRMTVYQVIQALSYYPPDMAVLVEDGKGWYKHVSQLHGPEQRGEVTHQGDGTVKIEMHWSDDDSGYLYPTVMQGDTYDCRGM